jgi:acyl-CoA oxidase
MQEYVINTPNNEASKAWIGGTGQHGKITVVFAQLYTQGMCFVFPTHDSNSMSPSGR